MSPLFPLLALLARNDAYGYVLKRRIDAEFAPHWKIDFAQLYRSLAKLRAQGFVRVRVASSDGGPERKVYALTSRGRGALEQWLQESAASRDEFWVKAYLTQKIGIAAQMPLVIAGSDDPLLAELSQAAHAQWQVMGSTAGLFALAQGQAEVIGTHLRDPEANEYNISFVQHLVAEQDIVLVNLAVREYGLLVARDNPKNIRGIRELARRGVQLINRPQGSGARLWLQRHLRAARIDPLRLRGWSRAAATYNAVANAIATGAADVGPGLRATAEKWGLDFIALGEERFDLTIPRAVYESKRAHTLRELVHSKKFRAHAQTLAGYDVSQSGRVIAEIKYGSRRTNL